MNLIRSLFLAIVMLCAIGEPAFANPTPLTTTLTAPSPGQTFSNMPSGTTYKADASGNVANVLASDVPAMLKAGCTQPTGGGGGGGATLPYPGIVYGTGPTGGTVATSNQIQSAIGTGIYDAAGAAAAAQTASDPSGAAAIVKAYFTALTGILSCNGSGCTASSTLPATSVTGLAPSATTDTTNATNITSGTLPAAREPAFTGDMTSTAGSTATTVTAINGGAVPASAPLLATNANGQTVSTSLDTLAGSPGAATSGLLARLSTNSYTLIQNLATGLCGAATNLFSAPVCANFFGYYDPRWYGAKVDGQNLTGLTTTGGAATVSGYTFSAGDVGKNITLYAGTAVANTITTVSGSFQATVGTNLGATVSRKMAIYVAGVPNGTQIDGFCGQNCVVMTKAATASGSAVSGNFVGVFNSTIASVSGGIATLAANVTTSETAAFGAMGTDDEPAYASTVAAAAANGNLSGALIREPAGMSIFGSSLVWAGNVSMINPAGWGKGTIKWLSTTVQSAPVIGDAYLNGASCTPALAAAYSNITFQDVEIDGSAATLGSYSVYAKGLGFPCSKNPQFKHVYVHDTAATAIATDAGYNTSLSDSYLEDGGRLGSGQIGSNCWGEGVFGNPGESYLAINNTFKNCTNFAILYENQTTTAASVPMVSTGNTVITDFRSSGGISDGTAGGVSIGDRIYCPYQGSAGTQSTEGFQVGPATLSTVPGIQTVVTDLSVTGCYKGLHIDATYATGNVTGKYLISNINIVGSVVYGLQISSNASYTTDDISLSHVKVSGSGYAGIYFSGAGGFKNVKLDNVQAYGNGLVQSGAAAAGIYVNANITGLDLENSVAHDDGATHQLYGLEIGTGFAVTGGQMVGNDFTGNVTAGVRVDGTFTGLIGPNQGFPTFTVSGACASTSPVGQGDVGTFLSGTSGTCTTTILPYGTANIIAPNGWSCLANDITTPSDLIGQTASTTTGCTLTGTTVSGDKVAFQAKAF